MTLSSTATHSSFKSLAVLAGALCLTIWSGIAPVRAQQGDIRSLTDRLDRLQRDVDTLNRQIARPGGQPGQPLGQVGGQGFSTSFIDRTDQRFAELDNQIRDLTGKLEEVAYRLNELNSRLDKLAGDVEYRLTALERGGGGGGASAPASAPPVTPPAPTRQAAQSLPQPPSAAPRPGEPRVAIVPGGPAGQTAPPPLLPPGTPEQQFGFAYNELVKAQRGQTDFDRPEQLLRLFVQSNGSHRLAGSAQYWLGETYFARRDYPRSAAAFAEGLQRFPNSDKGPDNLLRLGQSLAQLNRNRDACGALGEMERRYPQAPQAVRRDATRERQRLNCA